MGRLTIDVPRFADRLSVLSSQGNIIRLPEPSCVTLRIFGIVPIRVVNRDHSVEVCSLVAKIISCTDPFLYKNPGEGVPISFRSTILAGIALAD